MSRTELLLNILFTPVFLICCIQGASLWAAGLLWEAVAMYSLSGLFLVAPWIPGMLKKKSPACA